MDCDEAPGISALLTGFPAQSTSLSAELERMNNRLAAITSGVAGVRDQAAQIADTVRRVHRVVSTEVTDCPRLFTLLPVRGAALAAPARVHEDHYRLTLWCEHPGDEHPWKQAAYELDVPKEWFTRIAPYAKLVCQTLQLIVPLAGAVATAVVPAVQRTSTQNELKIMTTLVGDLSVTVGQHDEKDLAKFSGQLSAAQGEALRALRAVIFERDRLRAFGDLRRVQTPAGDLLWVCRDHYHEYDPGLPKVSDLDSLPAKDADTDRVSAVSGENDWYGGQPAAANGASFADTGTYRLSGHFLDEDGSGPRGRSFADTGSSRFDGRALAEDEYQASAGRGISGAPQEVSARSGSAGSGEPGDYSGRVPLSLAGAVQSARKEGQAFGESVARDAPALWIEAVLARDPRMPSDLEARLLQGSALPIDFLLRDEVRHALRRGFWDALKRARR
jgi:hypothetical protein